jgi:hypothetical protein
MSNFGSNFLALQLLKELGSRIGDKTKWFGKDKKQQTFADRDYGDLEMSEIEGKSQIGGTNEVKDFLLKKSIELNLPDEIGSDDICAAVVLDIKAKWLSKGMEVKIKKLDTPDQYYDAARMNGSCYKDKDGFMFARAMLKNFDFVIFEQKTNTRSSIEEMEENGRHFLKSFDDGKTAMHNYTTFTFPQVDLDSSRDVLELIGMKAQGTSEFTVAIAKGRCLLQLNHIGAKLKMAMGGVAMTTSIRQEFNWEINDSFCVHFCRNEWVYASVFVTPEHFKKVDIDFGPDDYEEIDLSEDDFDDDLFG